ncbi:hypothetical protein RZS08_38060, partial [Arthrospira platensis SPKY1]|nr:hypothetical protein [Arthrospira platensis SPKY1]
MIKAMVFDTERMQLLWETSLMLDDFNYYQHFQQVVLDNHGNMTLIIEKDNFRSKRNSHHFELFTYFADRHLLERFDLPIPEKLTYDVYFTYDHVNNRLVGGGLYSERNLGRPDGY